MGFNSRKRSRAARMREALQEQRSAGTSRSRSGASTARRRRSTSSSSSSSRSGNSRVSSRSRGAATSSQKRRRSTNSRVSSRSRGAGISSQSRVRTATTPKRRSVSSAQSRAPAAPTGRRKARSSSRTQSRSVKSRTTTRSRQSSSSSSSRSRAGNGRTTTRQRIQQRAASQHQLRSVNGLEHAALIFTFWDEVGQFLADTIKIGAGTSDNVTKTEMLLHQRYSSSNLSDLGDFIGQAARIWQQHTGRYTKRDGLYDGYNYKQLYEVVFKNGQRLLDLDSTAHAEAVKDWFSVNQGVEFNKIGSGSRRIPKKDLWSRILEVLDLDDDHKSKFLSKSYGGEKAAMRQIVNNHYACLIKELRDPELIQRETRQRVPTATPQTAQQNPNSSVNNN